MLKHDDASNELKNFAKDLRRIKPPGWSVVLGSNEIFVRPADRTAGKFSITFIRDKVCSAMFFSRELNYWNKNKYFYSNAAIAASVKEWMESAAAEPLRREVSDWKEFLT